MNDHDDFSNTLFIMANGLVTCSVNPKLSHLMKMI